MRPDNIVANSDGEKSKVSQAPLFFGDCRQERIKAQTTTPIHYKTKGVA